MPGTDLAITGNAEELERRHQEVAEQTSPEIEGLIAELMDGPSFQEMAVAGIQELFERVITLENALADTIAIIADNVDQPMTMATKLRELLAPQEAGVDTPWTSEDEAALNDAFKPEEG